MSDALLFPKTLSTMHWDIYGDVGSGMIAFVIPAAAKFQPRLSI